MHLLRSVPEGVLARRERFMGDTQQRARDPRGLPRRSESATKLSQPFGLWYRQISVTEQCVPIASRKEELTHGHRKYPFQR